MGVLLFAISLVSVIQFILREADNFMEYTESVYIIVASIMVEMYFSIMVFKMKNLFEFIANIENCFDGKRINEAFGI